MTARVDCPTHTASIISTSSAPSRKVEALTERPGATGVTTTGDDKDIVLTTAGDRVFQRSGGRWQEIRTMSGVVTAGT